MDISFKIEPFSKVYRRHIVDILTVKNFKNNEWLWQKSILGQPPGIRHHITG